MKTRLLPAYDEVVAHPADTGGRTLPVGGTDEGACSRERSTVSLSL